MTPSIIDPWSSSPAVLNTNYLMTISATEWIIFNILLICQIVAYLMFSPILIIIFHNVLIVFTVNNQLCRFLRSRPTRVSASVSSSILESYIRYMQIAFAIMLKSAYSVFVRAVSSSIRKISLSIYQFITSISTEWQVIPINWILCLEAASTIKANTMGNYGFCIGWWYNNFS